MDLAQAERMIAKQYGAAQCTMRANLDTDIDRDIIGKLTRGESLDGTEAVYAAENNLKPTK